MSSWLLPAWDDFGDPELPDSSPPADVARAASDLSAGKSIPADQPLLESEPIAEVTVAGFPATPSNHPETKWQNHGSSYGDIAELLDGDSDQDINGDTGQDEGDAGHDALCVATTHVAPAMHTAPAHFASAVHWQQPRIVKQESDTQFGPRQLCSAWQQHQPQKQKQATELHEPQHGCGLQQATQQKLKQEQQPLLCGDGATPTGGDKVSCTEPQALRLGQGAATLSASFNRQDNVTHVKQEHITTAVDCDSEMSSDDDAQGGAQPSAGNRSSIPISIVNVAARPRHPERLSTLTRSGGLSQLVQVPRVGQQSAHEAAQADDAAATTSGAAFDELPVAAAMGTSKLSAPMHFVSAGQNAPGTNEQHHLQQVKHQSSTTLKGVASVAGQSTNISIGAPINPQHIPRQKQQPALKHRQGGHSLVGVAVLHQTAPPTLSKAGYGPNAGRRLNGFHPPDRDAATAAAALALPVLVDQAAPAAKRQKGSRSGWTKRGAVTQTDALAAAGVAGADVWKQEWQQQAHEGLSDDEGGEQQVHTSRQAQQQQPPELVAERQGKAQQVVDVDGQDEAFHDDTDHAQQVQQVQQQEQQQESLQVDGHVARPSELGNSSKKGTVPQRVYYAAPDPILQVVDYDSLDDGSSGNSSGDEAAPPEDASKLGPHPGGQPRHQARQQQRDLGPQSNSGAGAYGSRAEGGLTRGDRKRLKRQRKLAAASNAAAVSKTVVGEASTVVQPAGGKGEDDEEEELVELGFYAEIKANDKSNKKRRKERLVARAAADADPVAAAGLANGRGYAAASGMPSAAHGNMQTHSVRDCTRQIGAETAVGGSGTRGAVMGGGAGGWKKKPFVPAATMEAAGSTGFGRGKRQRPVFEVQLKKVCRYWQLGRCTKGDTCTFVHEGAPITKLLRCKLYARGACRKTGDECSHSHEATRVNPCHALFVHGTCTSANCKESHEPLSESDAALLREYFADKQQRHEKWQQHQPSAAPAVG